MSFSNTLVLALAICATVACVHADCDACVDGVCHSRHTLISGFPVTDQLAIDRSRNILYLQLNGNLNTAVSLNNQEIRLIYDMYTTGMVFNQESKKLYTGTEIAGYLLKYDFESNTTKIIKIDDDVNPDLLFYYPNGFVFVDSINNNSIFHRTRTIYGTLAIDSYHVNYTVSSLVIGTAGTIFFVSNNILYSQDRSPPWEEPEPPIEILSRENIVLSADKNGNIYIGDASEKVIYKFAEYENKLSIYAAYKTGAVEDFVFAADNSIVFRDANGSVVHWVPKEGSFENQRKDCAIDLPFDHFVIRSLDDGS